MKKFKVLIACALVLTCTFATACGGNGNGNGDGDEDQVYNLRLAGINPPTSMDTVLMEEAAKEIAERTDGKVNITVYPANALGDYVQLYDEVIRGTIEMACIVMPPTYTDLAALGAMPFMAGDYEDLKGVYAPDSYFNKVMTEINADQGVKLLGLVTSGLNGIGAVNADPDTVFDFSVKKDGMLRIGDFELTRITLEEMGYNIVTLPYSEAYIALQTGVANAWFGGGAQLNYEGFRDAIKYYIDYKLMDDFQITIINQKVFDGLPVEYQDIIAEVMGEISMESIDKRAQLEEEYFDQLRNYGIEVLIPTDEQIEYMVTHVRTNVWPQLEEIFGKEHVEGLLNDLGL